MQKFSPLSLALFVCASAAAAPVAPIAALPADQKAFECPRCAEWNRPVDPYALSANSWYVGTHGLASVLIVDEAGLILIDGGLPQSAAQILANVRKAGYDPANIRWILNSHAHFDHAGGIAALARLTGASVAAGRAGAAALGKGLNHADDPQSGFGEGARFPSVASVVGVDDGDVITVGETRVTAIASPGHTPGGMSWTWKSCEEKNCRDVVYLDSLNPVSADGYRFLDHPKTLAALRASIDRLGKLPCAIAMAAHPDQLPKVEGNSMSLCAAYANNARDALEQRLTRENAKTAP